MWPFVAGAIWIGIGIVLLVFRAPIAAFSHERLTQAGRVAKAPARAASTSTMVFLGLFALFCGIGIVVFGVSRLLQVF
ncbi:MAG TPA: hypothetical protein VM430_10810 [Microbacterium sp.]|nr:hypothetical protein [Microbacterium sp.]